MKVFNLFMVTHVIAVLVSCGTGDSKQSPTPVVLQTPSQSAPTTLPQNPPVASETKSVQTTDESTTDETTTATTASTVATTQPTAQDLAAYYDSQYAQQNQSQYDPESSYYFQEVDQLSNTINQPYGNQVDFSDYKAPYLESRYRQHRALLNYGASFNRVNVGHGHWNRDNYDRTRNHFRHSIEWLNQIPKDGHRTLECLEKRGFRSRNNLEGRFRDAISRRDHRSIVTMNDQLLDEYQNSNMQDKDNNDNRGHKDNEHRR